MLLRFQKPAVRENCGTGNRAFSMRLRFLAMRDHHDDSSHAGTRVEAALTAVEQRTVPGFAGTP